MAWLPGVDANMEVWDSCGRVHACVLNIELVRQTWGSINGLWKRHAFKLQAVAFELALFASFCQHAFCVTCLDDNKSCQGLRYIGDSDDYDFDLNNW